jgi:hypothetical protein
MIIPYLILAGKPEILASFLLIQLLQNGDLSDAKDQRHHSFINPCVKPCRAGVSLYPQYLRYLVYYQASANDPVSLSCFQLTLYANGAPGTDGIPQSPGLHSLRLQLFV